MRACQKSMKGKQTPPMCVWGCVCVVCVVLWVCVMCVWLCVLWVCVVVGVCVLVCASVGGFNCVDNVVQIL